LDVLTRLGMRQQRGLTLGRFDAFAGNVEMGAVYLNSNKPLSKICGCNASCAAPHKRIKHNTPAQNH